MSNSNFFQALDVLHEQAVARAAAQTPASVRQRRASSVGASIEDDRKYRFNKGALLRWKQLNLHDEASKRPKGDDGGGRKKSIAMAVDSWLQ